MAPSNLGLCYEGIQRCYRNTVVRHLRTRLTVAFGTEAVTKLRVPLEKEWATIKRNAEQSRHTGHIAAPIQDEFDILSVNHFYCLFQKYPVELLVATTDEQVHDAQRKALLGWMGEIKAVRDPISHPTEADLPYSDAFRTLDSARRVIEQLGYPPDELLQFAGQLIGAPSTPVAPEDVDTVRKVPLVARLPQRETVVADFVGRADELAQLEAWFRDERRRRWMLTGDGGKGKSSLAYQFAELVRERAPTGFHMVMWLSAKRRRFV
jgi:hypothetical protein